jgi:hypothetical protein
MLNSGWEHNTNTDEWRSADGDFAIFPADLGMHTAYRIKGGSRVEITKTPTLAEAMAVCEQYANLIATILAKRTQARGEEYSRMTGGW